MTKYRTLEQFEDIVDDCINGNWSDAAESCVEYGFYANDLIRMNEEHNQFAELTDIAILSELAAEKRYKKLN